MNPVRRIVTAIDTQGRSYFLADGDTPSILTVPERPGYCVQNLWRTDAAPSRIDAPDPAALIKGTAPPVRGTVMRTIDIPPEAKDPEQRRRNAEATFRAIFSDLHRPAADSPHPAFHTTDTIDYAIVLSGEIYAVMDRGETLMRAGDVLIQRGTPHAWSNRSSAICRVLFILVDAQR
jgi:mannose-6-phosphate isomerase-like protein (cupin superfamily)